MLALTDSVRRRVSRLAVPVVLLLCAVSDAEELFKVVAHPSIPGGQIKRETLAAVFLKQVPRWGDGTPVQPVDQSTQSPVRQSFSDAVLKQTVLAVQNYWRQQISGGRVRPPVVKASDAEVAAFVKATKGAVGYVSVGFATDEGVKLIRIVE